MAGAALDSGQSSLNGGVYVCPRRRTVNGLLKMITLLIADEHAVVRAGLRSIIDGCPQLSIVAEAADGKDAVAQASATKPDLAIVAYSLPRLNGIEVTRQIRRCVPGVEVLILTMHDNESLVRDLMMAGARGYVRKSDPEQSLIAAIKSLASHRPYFTDRASSILLQNLSGKGRTKQILTRREQSIVRMVTEGLTNKQIASALCISVKTVETHRAALRQKLGFRSIADVVRYATRNNLIEA